MKPCCQGEGEGEGAERKARTRGTWSLHWRALQFEEKAAEGEARIRKRVCVGREIGVKVAFWNMMAVEVQGQDASSWHYGGMLGWMPSAKPQ